MGSIMKLDIVQPIKASVKATITCPFDGDSTKVTVSERRHTENDKEFSLLTVEQGPDSVSWTRSEVGHMIKVLTEAHKIMIGE